MQAEGAAVAAQYVVSSTGARIARQFSTLLTPPNPSPASDSGTRIPLVSKRLGFAVFLWLASIWLQRLALRCHGARLFGDPIERDVATAIHRGEPDGRLRRRSKRSARRRNERWWSRLRRTGDDSRYVIDRGRVRWEPALNLNVVIPDRQIIAIVLFLSIRGLISTPAELRTTRLGGLRPG
jgi:hypothetical protein